MTSRRNDMKELSRMADRVCVLILNSDYPDVDVEIEREKVRQRCEQLFPDRMDLFELIYESRFERLWQQFREPESQARASGEEPTG